jgi:predicted DNA-binding transcriptional regulator AlpA
MSDQPGSVAIPESILVKALGMALTSETTKLLDAIDINEHVLLDANQGAKMLGVSLRRFRELPIDYVDLGQRRTRWKLSDLKAFIDSRKVLADHRRRY